MSIRNRILLFAFIIVVPVFSFFLFQKKLLILHGKAFGSTYIIKTYVPIWVSQRSVELNISKEIQRINSIFSTWDSDSELSRFNNNQSLLRFPVSLDIQKVFTDAKKLYELTGGYYDPTIKPVLDIWGFSSGHGSKRQPSDDELIAVRELVGMNKVELFNGALQKMVPGLSLELSSLAEGYAIDMLAEILENHQSKRYMIEVGGEVRVRNDSRSRNWILGITNPSYHHSEQGVYVRLSVKNGCVATSGDYRNYFHDKNTIYSHIFDPIQMRPVQNHLASVTVIASTCVVADGLATAIMAVGKENGLDLVETMPYVEAMLLYRSEGTVQRIVSSGFSKYLIH